MDHEFISGLESIADGEPAPHEPSKPNSDMSHLLERLNNSIMQDRLKGKKEAEKRINLAQDIARLLTIVGVVSGLQQANHESAPQQPPSQPNPIISTVGPKHSEPPMKIVQPTATPEFIAHVDSGSSAHDPAEIAQSDAPITMEDDDVDSEFVDKGEEETLDTAEDPGAELTPDAEDTTPATEEPLESATSTPETTPDPTEITEESLPQSLQELGISYSDTTDLKPGETPVTDMEKKLDRHKRISDIMFKIIPLEFPSMFKDSDFKSIVLTTFDNSESDELAITMSTTATYNPLNGELRITTPPNFPLLDESGNLAERPTGMTDESEFIYAVAKALTEAFLEIEKQKDPSRPYLTDWEKANPTYDFGPIALSFLKAQSISSQEKFFATFVALVSCGETRDILNPDLGLVNSAYLFDGKLKDWDILVAARESSEKHRGADMGESEEAVGAEEPTESLTED